MIISEYKELKGCTMKNGFASNFKNKVLSFVGTVKEYWNEPAKDNYIPYKEVAAISGAGFGVHWTTLLASTIALSASNFLVGASIGLKPMDLQIMLTVANIVGIPIGIFRGWYYDNHHLKGGKFLPFIKRTATPIALISLIFVWLPYESWAYNTKAVVVWLMYMLLSIFLGFYNESYTYYQQIMTPNAQERATVMSISQVIYSLAPTITGLFIPLIAGMTWGLNNIWTYRIIYPAFTVIGLVMNIIFFRKVKERLILPKKIPEPIRMFDAIREVAKNKYYWIIQAAGWIGFLESGYTVILSWSFVYGNNGENEKMLGLANTVIGNAALWSMILAPLAIKLLGKRNLLIISNTINVFVVTALYFTYENLLIVCILWYFNNFVSTFWNIVQHNINADLRDYHQWKTGVRVDGLFGPLGIIGTIIGFFTGLFYPALYENHGLSDNYDVLYNNALRGNLFESLIIFSAIGAFLNLVPFFFYDLTENKHRAYVDVLKIRAMFENASLGELTAEELTKGMDIITEAKELFHKEKLTADKSILKAAKALPHKTKEEKALRKSEIKKVKQQLKATKETNLAIERSVIIVKDLEKFTSEAGKARLKQAEADLNNGIIYHYENAKSLLKNAQKMPKTTKSEKEIREDAIKNAKIKKEAANLIKKYGIENITEPDPDIKHKIQNREAESFIDTLKIRHELKKFAKAESVYSRATKPYKNAKNLISQADNYAHFEELKERYEAVSTKK